MSSSMTDWLADLSPDQMRQMLLMLNDKLPEVVMLALAEVTHSEAMGIDLEKTSRLTSVKEVTPCDPPTNDTAAADEDDWETRFMQLALYKAKHGNCEVPELENPSLHQWLETQHMDYIAFFQGIDSQLSEEKRDKLLSIGFEFVNPQDKEGGDDDALDQNQSPEKKSSYRHVSWDEWLVLLKQFKAEHGHTDVPQKDESGLGLWVMKQRQNYRRSQQGKPSPMTDERIEVLKEMDFSFNTSGTKTPWKDRFQELVEYKDVHGHTRVPVKRPRDRDAVDPEKMRHAQLGKWADHQRTQYKLRREGKKSAMTEERIELLEGIGFEFVVPRNAPPPGINTNVAQKRPADDGNEQDDEEVDWPSKKKQKKGDRKIQNKRWNDMYEELRKFKEKNGHCRVVVGRKTYCKLGKWVEHQRTQFRLLQQDKRSGMTEERQKKLLELGFEFKVKSGKRLSVESNKDTPKKDDAAKEDATKEDAIREDSTKEDTAAKGDTVAGEDAAKEDATGEDASTKEDSIKKEDVAEDASPKEKGDAEKASTIYDSAAKEAIEEAVASNEGTIEV